MSDVCLSDISQVVRLVREVCDRWDDPPAWREHLLSGACRLLDGTTGTMIAEYGGSEQDGAFGRLAVIAVVGVPDELRSFVQPAVSSFDLRTYGDASKEMPGISEMYAQIVRQGWVTAQRSQLTDDAAHHAGSHYHRFRQAIDAEDYVVSIRLVDIPRRAQAMKVDRPRGAPRFGPREVALMKLLHDEIAPLIGVRLATERHLCRDGLSRRLRQTLSLLLEGRSEKEAARELRLHPRTLHQYVSTLYSHFRVSSRAELMAYFVRRQPSCRRVPAASASPAPDVMSQP